MVICEPQGQWLLPKVGSSWCHFEVSLDKTPKPRSCAVIYCLTAVQQQYPQGINKVCHYCITGFCVQEFLSSNHPLSWRTFKPLCTCLLSFCCHCSHMSHHSFTPLPPLSRPHQGSRGSRTWLFVGLHPHRPQWAGLTPKSLLNKVSVVLLICVSRDWNGRYAESWSLNSAPTGKKNIFHPQYGAQGGRMDAPAICILLYHNVYVL